MRLKTRIILICCISILISSIISSVVVYRMVQTSAVDAAESESMQDAWQTFLSLRDRVSVLLEREEEMDTRVLQYYIKQQKDDMLVCFYGQDQKQELFNSTIFEQADFEELHYNMVPGIGIRVAKMQWEGRHYRVYLDEAGINGCQLYKLEDITYVWERTRLLGLGMIILSCVITASLSLLILVALNKLLHPLQKLNASAKQIARGRYDERIPVERNDEIGELSDNFNQMAEAIQGQIRRLQEEEERRTLFMGNLTHELKTPMTAISGYAKTLLTVKLPEEDAEEALTYIYEESCRLERLSKKMMNLLLLEEDDQVHRMEISAAELFRGAQEACSQSLAAEEICLECQDHGQHFYVDADLFTEVLINLIDNARKASKPGDRIILSAAEQRIEVRDFGSGIPEEERDKILEPFYMIDKSRSRKNGGAGLGLAVTVLILKRHHCELQIDSAVGKGTRMILQFV